MHATFVRIESSCFLNRPTRCNILGRRIENSVTIIQKWGILQLAQSIVNQLYISAVPAKLTFDRDARESFEKLHLGFSKLEN